MRKKITRTERASILVVDDQETNLKLLQLRLGDQGYGVRLFPDGRSALAYAVQHPPDLILLDINMPGMNGFEVFDRLRTYPNLAHVPVIFLSGSDGVADKVQAFQSGAVDYVTKPFEFDELQSRIENHLQVYRLQRERQRHSDELEELIRARTRDLEESRVEVLQRLAIAAEYRDKNAGKHTQRVGYLAALLAKALGVSGPESELIGLAAPLHDIGKIGIPDGILLARRQLTAEEFEIMKSHVSIGSSILSGSKSALLQMAERIAQYHHERWDGSGYCAGLAGQAVPLPARIVSVVDTFDALTHVRPYKRAWSVEEAMVEIRRQSGRQFDPCIVSAFGILVAQGVVVVEPLDDLRNIGPRFDASLLQLADCVDGCRPVPQTWGEAALP